MLHKKHFKYNHFCTSGKKKSKYFSNFQNRRIAFDEYFRKNCRRVSLQTKKIKTMDTSI